MRVYTIRALLKDGQTAAYEFIEPDISSALIQFLKMEDGLEEKITGLSLSVKPIGNLKEAE